MTPFFFMNDVHNGYEIDRVFGVRPRLISNYFDNDVWEYMLGLKREGKSIPQIFMDNGEEMIKILEADYSSSWNPFDGKTLVIDEADRMNLNLLDLKGNIYYHGYWIHKYWMNRLEEAGERLEFKPADDRKNLEIFKMINETESCAIHIRRGDYVDLGLVPDNSAIKFMTGQMIEKFPKTCLFVFSDDIDWCRKNEKNLGFDRFNDIYYVSNNHGNNAYKDAWLMSNCRYMILSNSAFCYLSALLNKKLRFCINPNRNRPLIDNGGTKW
ncbi:MAG: alpha-1,2-fucosyltransferase [Lachnospiraceae bacterium]|nr:alpha-1,2-fucosyltransferase [Lachnospiraceae bacterium]